MGEIIEVNSYSKFNNVFVTNKIHDYPQWKLVGIHSEHYDNFLYGYTLIEDTPVKIYPEETTFKEVALDLELVTSHTDLKRLLKQGGIELYRYNEKVPFQWMDTLPTLYQWFYRPIESEGVWEIRKGQRVLELVIGFNYE